MSPAGLVSAGIARARTAGSRFERVCRFEDGIAGMLLSFSLNGNPLYHLSCYGVLTAVSIQSDLSSFQIGTWFLSLVDVCRSILSYTQGEQAIRQTGSPIEIRGHPDYRYEIRLAWAWIYHGIERLGIQYEQLT
jgi:hypothetical protein